MLNWALKYLSLGFSVIPLRPNGKEPLIKWEEWQAKRPSATLVTEWFTKWPDANIGLVTGSVSGIVVIDLDGAKGLNAALEMRLHSSLICLTGNGKHLYYKWAEGLRNSASKIAEGIDVRGEGGYVCAPPSVHPNGRRYCWKNARNVGSLPDYPPALCVTNVGKTDMAADTKAESWIDEAFKDLRKGHVHNTLVSVLGKFRAHNFSEEITYELLKPHCLENGRPFDGLRSKITEIWGRYEPNSNGIQSRNLSLAGFGTGETDSTTADAETIEDFLSTEEAVKWIVPGLIAQSSLGFVVGLPETNKTWALLDLAIESAQGGKWLGCFPVKQYKVWFIDQERFRGETKRRFRAICAAKGIQSKDLLQLRINSGNTSFKIDLDQSFAAFRKRISEFRPDLVIIDSLATFHTKEENNRMEIQKVIERIKALKNEFGCTFLFIHHENKLSFQSTSEGKEPTYAEMSGNIAIPAAADTVITVRKRIDDSSIVYHTKSTMAKRHKPFEIRVIDLDGPNKIEVKGYL